MPPVLQRHRVLVRRSPREQKPRLPDPTVKPSTDFPDRTIIDYRGYSRRFSDWLSTDAKIRKQLRDLEEVLREL
jgi:hypothetical protein